MGTTELTLAHLIEFADRSDHGKQHLGSLGERLPAEQAQAGALRLVEVMGLPITSEAFRSLASILGNIPVVQEAVSIDTASNVLQAPMAFDKTREHLLRYYSPLASVFETSEEFKTTDDLIAWAREHNPLLELTRLLDNPFQ